MILACQVCSIRARPCPHTRGDDPTLMNLSRAVYKLVPIRVGMILLTPQVIANEASCPHTRGDDPDSLFNVCDHNLLSPYAWG